MFNWLDLQFVQERHTGVDRRPRTFGRVVLAYGLFDADLAARVCTGGHVYGALADLAENLCLDVYVLSVAVVG